MASKKHPLDVFRTTDSGFDSATRDDRLRDRRRVDGRVLGSVPNASEEDPTDLELETEDEFGPENEVEPVSELEPVNAPEPAGLELDEADVPAADAPDDGVPDDGAPDDGLPDGEEAAASAHPTPRLSELPPASPPARRKPGPELVSASPASPAVRRKPRRVTPEPVRRATPRPTGGLPDGRPARTGAALRPPDTSGTSAGTSPGTKLFRLALVLAGLLFAWVVIQKDWQWGGETGGDEETALASTDGDQTLAPAEGVVGYFTALAITYTPSWEDTARQTTNALQARGFDAALLMVPKGDALDEADPGSYELRIYVGKASEEDALDLILARLRAIDDWPDGNDPKPFSGAYPVWTEAPRDG